jgi:hypothetical protein
MGYGSYSAADWSKLKTSRQLSNTNSVGEVFQRKSCDPKYDPRYIGTRECFDSDDHPSSTPIVVGLDVTASMGYLAVEVATKALNELIMKLYSTGSIEDPALMCAAYGDYRDVSPVQVTQFESDIRIAEQLLELYFENGGQGDVVPTCLWHFLANHTNIDAIKKRNQKGFVFTIGDNAEIRGNISPAITIRKVMGDESNAKTPEDVLKDAEKKFHIFHIMIGGDNTYNRQLMNGHAMMIHKTDIDLIPQIIISTIQLQNGKQQGDILEQWDAMERPRLANILGQLQIRTAKRGFFL